MCMTACRPSRPRTVGRLVSGCESETAGFYCRSRRRRRRPVATSSSSIDPSIDRPPAKYLCAGPAAAPALLRIGAITLDHQPPHAPHDRPAGVCMIARGRWRKEGRNLALRLRGMVAGRRPENERGHCRRCLSRSLLAWTGGQSGTKLLWLWQ